jgi:hypothetical protein
VGRETALRRLQRVRRYGFGVGVLAICLSAIGAVANPGQFFASYLVAYLFWQGIALGCLAMALVYRLTGGFWGRETHAILEAAAATVPWLAVMFLPIVVGIPSLYVWSTTGAGTPATAVGHQQSYLNIPFFLVRAAVYLAIWIVLARRLIGLSVRLDQTDDPRLAARLRRLGAVGLIVLGLTVSFAMIDWVMSLEPSLTSTVFPAMVGAGDLLVGFAFAIAVVCWLGDRSPLERQTLLRLLNDLGGLLLALVLLWAYLSFSQLLLIWAGNLNAEITWYLHRLYNGWQWVGLVVGVTQFVVPFIALLSRDVKRSPRAMFALAAILLVGRFVELIWLVEPSLPPRSVLSHWLNLSLGIGLGGIWVAAFSGQLRERIERGSGA